MSQEVVCMLSCYHASIWVPWRQCTLLCLMTKRHICCTESVSSSPSRAATFIVFSAFGRFSQFLKDSVKLVALCTKPLNQKNNLAMEDQHGVVHISEANTKYLSIASMISCKQLHQPVEYYNIHKTSASVFLSHCHFPASWLTLWDFATSMASFRACALPDSIVFLSSLAACTHHFSWHISETSPVSVTCWQLHRKLRDQTSITWNLQWDS